jgi:glycine dehydrogenase
MDYGFHAPTMSFPVAGTLMVEPTESEDIAEIERFISAMISIHGEIMEVQNGVISHEDSPLAHAPHTAGDVISSQWDRKYPREIAAFPEMLSGFIPGEIIGLRGKYWPTSGRIDGAFGDRNLICACPPIESFAQ